tara:strand:- start:953 stop:1135 length:183 start_codon:yes stop_codon:yes gene_type:complete
MPISQSLLIMRRFIRFFLALMVNFTLPFGGRIRHSKRLQTLMLTEPALNQSHAFFQTTAI